MRTGFGGTRGFARREFSSGAANVLGFIGRACESSIVDPVSHPGKLTCKCRCFRVRRVSGTGRSRLVQLVGAVPVAAAASS